MRRWCEGAGRVLTRMLYGGEKVFLLPLTRRLDYRLPKGREQMTGKLDRGSALDTVVPEGVPAIKILNKDDILPIGALVQVQEDGEQAEGKEVPSAPVPPLVEPATPFKPKGAMAEIKRDVFIRLQAYQQRTKLGWAQRVSDATGGKVAPDVVRLGLLEARDIGVDRWKLIGKALDKLEEEMEK